MVAIETEIEESSAASPVEILVTRQEIVLVVTGEIEVTEEAAVEEIEEAETDLILHQEVWIDTMIEVVAEG